MPEEKVLPKDRIASSFKQLSAVSTDLNNAAQELGKSISSLESALRSLNLGISAWQMVAGHEDDDGSYWSRDIGHTMVGDSWRIALRKANGHYPSDHHCEEVWAFNDAPRWMCIESVGKLPDLFEKLIKQAAATTEQIRAKTAETEAFAAAVREVRKQAELEAQAKRARK